MFCLPQTREGLLLFSFPRVPPPREAAGASHMLASPQGGCTQLTSLEKRVHFRDLILRRIRGGIAYERKLEPGPRGIAFQKVPSPASRHLTPRAHSEERSSKKKIQSQVPSSPPHSHYAKMDGDHCQPCWSALRVSFAWLSFLSSNLLAFNG